MPVFQRFLLLQSGTSDESRTLFPEVFMTKSENLIGAFLCANNRLNANRAKIDSYNVFPVPDSDTGTNLCRTFKAAALAVKGNEALSAEELFEKASKAMLRSARGNSGVIFSALFKGFSDHILKNGLETDSLSAAFDSALRNACRVLSRPIFKGTVLSVVIACRDALLNNVFSSLSDAVAFLVPVCQKATEKTGEEQKQAKIAGVVDSGAAGFTVIIEGFDSFLSKKTLPLPDADDGMQREIIFKKLSPTSEIAFAYCTEFIIIKKGFFPLSSLESTLKMLGDSVIVAEDEDIIKVHLHTNNPDRALAAAMRHGMLTDIKIDNMALQIQRNGNR